MSIYIFLSQFESPAHISITNNDKSHSLKFKLVLLFHLCFHQDI